jgi:hypothetical protein
MHTDSLLPRRFLAGLTLLSVVAISFGCTQTPSVVPVSGKVVYNGEPLPFGTVMFQPEQGQAAQGEIQPDGTFQLSTYGPNDGAVPGHHKVSVRCFSTQKPGADGGDAGAPGRLLIPQQYTRFGMSGLSADVKPGSTEPVVLELKGPPLPKGL